MIFPSTRGGDRIAVITRNATVRVWDAANLGVAPLSYSTGAISRAASSPDGQVLAIAGSRGVLLFDAYTLAELSRVETTRNNVQNLAVRGNGSDVVAVASEGPVRIWDTSSGSVISSLAPQETGLMDYVYRVALSDDGNTLATGWNNGSVKVWNVGAVLGFTTLPNEGIVYQMVSSPDGNQVLTAGDKSARIWDRNGSRRFELPTSIKGSVYGAVFTTRGDTVATAEVWRAIQLWNTRVLNEKFVYKVSRPCQGSYRYQPSTRKA